MFLLVARLVKSRGWIIELQSGDVINWFVCAVLSPCGSRFACWYSFSLQCTREYPNVKYECASIWLQAAIKDDNMIF